MSWAELTESYLRFQKEVHFTGGLSNRFVPGTGPIPAELMIVGEAPGEVEDRRRRPFVGPAGKILDDLLEDVDINRGDVFVTNTVKYRPPDNRKPTSAEIQQSLPILRREIRLAKPKVVVLTGLTAVAAFFPGMRFKGNIGKVYKVRTKEFYIVTTLHPAATFYSQNAYRHLSNDFQKVSSILSGTFDGRVRPLD